MNDQGKNYADLSLETGILYDENRFSYHSDYIKYLKILAQKTVEYATICIRDKEIKK